MHAIPSQPLPLHRHWANSGEYIDSLLTFVSTTDLFRNLCGGVHVLDFLIREPDLYSWVLPADWREWVELVDIHDFLDLLLREDIDSLWDEGTLESDRTKVRWRGYMSPPRSLVEYVRTVRLHSLKREFQPVSSDVRSLPSHVAVGMKPKKTHEVVNFAAYVDQLSESLSQATGSPLSVIDFGSGQNYLGRTLACPPYNKHVIAIEQRHHNVEGAKGMDVFAKLAKKQKKIVNKKEYKRQLALLRNREGAPTPPPEMSDEVRQPSASEEFGTPTPLVESVTEVISAAQETARVTREPGQGSMTYIEHALESGHLEHILKSKNPNVSTTDDTPTNDQKSVVVSIHSCGNLTHHGLRSLTLNPSVQAVAMIGCCYNLLTERLGPATYKHPQLRPLHPRLQAISSTYDPHGFPMSQRLETFEFDINAADGSTKHEKGVRLNITARMMAVQAPYNWGREDSEMFFTRHFYRALLQRILLDRGVVRQATSPDHVHTPGNSLSGRDTQGTPLIIGSLRKSAFVSFEAYVRAALHKLTAGNEDVEEGKRIEDLTAGLLTDPDVVGRYEEKYAYGRKHLAVIWSLMAFSAGVVESVIVVDRWLWLREQPEVEDAWVEPVFGYDLSPRNLCVVGIKKSERQ